MTKNMSANAGDIGDEEAQSWSQGRFPGEGMAAHSSVGACLENHTGQGISRLHSPKSQSVRYNQNDLTRTHIINTAKNPPFFLPFY